MARGRASINPMRSDFICVFARRAVGSGRVNLHRARSEWSTHNHGYFPEGGTRWTYDTGLIKCVRSVPGADGVRHLLSVAAECPSREHVVYASLVSQGDLRAVVVNDAYAQEAAMFTPAIGLRRVMTELLPPHLVEYANERLEHDLERLGEHGASAPFAGLSILREVEARILPPIPRHMSHLVCHTAALYPSKDGFDVDPLDKLASMNWGVYRSYSDICLGIRAGGDWQANEPLAAGTYVREFGLRTRYHDGVGFTAVPVETASVVADALHGEHSGEFRALLARERNP